MRKLRHWGGLLSVIAMVAACGNNEGANAAKPSAQPPAEPAPEAQVSEPASAAPISPAALAPPSAPTVTTPAPAPVPPTVAAPVPSATPAVSSPPLSLPPAVSPPTPKTVAPPPSSSEGLLPTFISERPTERESVSHRASSTLRQAGARTGVVTRPSWYPQPASDGGTLAAAGASVAKGDVTLAIALAGDDARRALQKTVRHRVLEAINDALASSGQSPWKIDGIAWRRLEAELLHAAQLTKSEPWGDSWYCLIALPHEDALARVAGRLKHTTLTAAQQDTVVKTVKERLLN